MSRRGFGNLVLAVFCLGIFATSLSLLRGVIGSEPESARSVYFWALVTVTLTLNLFYGAVLLLRRRVLSGSGV